MQPCQDDLVCKCSNEKIPYFNAPLYLENKQRIGKVDEIFGPIRDYVSFLLFDIETQKHNMNNNCIHRRHQVDTLV